MATEKRCKGCQHVLPLQEFYRAVNGKYGRKSKCKNCENLYVQANREQIAKRKRRWYERNRQRLAERSQASRMTPEGRAKLNQRSVRYTQRNRDKKRARSALHNALSNGRMSRQSCEYCGNSDSQAHHHDYSKPLEVVWACFKCHREKLHGQTVVLDRQFWASGRW